jgi:large subunit ribosomal protein L35Ae
MKGTIVNYRLSRHVQKTNHMIVNVDGIESREKAQPLVGKEVVWTSPAKREIKGKVASAHGNKGNIRVIFEKGMPGQSLTTKVEINS